jgi:hypothetical protein
VKPVNEKVSLIRLIEINYQLPGELKHVFLVNQQFATQQDYSSLIISCSGTEFLYSREIPKRGGLQNMVLDAFLNGKKTDQYLLM